MALDFLLQKVKDAIYDDDNTTYKKGDNHGLIGQVEGLFGGLMGGGQQGGNNAPGTINNPMSSDQDPHGDPGAQYPSAVGQQVGYSNQGDLRQQYPNLKSSDEDPLGDPGAQHPQGQGNNSDDLRQRFPNLKSSDEDPYGDPGAQR